MNDRSNNGDDNNNGRNRSQAGADFEDLLDQSSRSVLPLSADSNTQTLHPTAYQPTGVRSSGDPSINRETSQPGSHPSLGSFTSLPPQPQYVQAAQGSLAQSLMMSGQRLQITYDNPHLSRNSQAPTQQDVPVRSSGQRSPPHVPSRPRSQTSLRPRLTQTSRQRASQSPNRSMQRSSQTIQWPEPSDEHPNLPLSDLTRNVPARTVGTGVNSGRNLMARFGHDQTLRTRFPLIIENPRNRFEFGTEVAQRYPNPSIVIPMGTSLEEICRRYPFHVWGTGLRLFLAERWTPEKVFNTIPQDTRKGETKTRPWNYLQQAYGRQAKKMREEDNLAPITKSKKRKARLSKKQGGESPQPSGDDKDKSDGVEGPSRKRQRRIASPYTQQRASSPVPQRQSPQPAAFIPQSLPVHSQGSSQATQAVVSTRPHALNTGVSETPGRRPRPTSGELIRTIEHHRSVILSARYQLRRLTHPGFAALSFLDQQAETQRNAQQTFRRWEDSMIQRHLPSIFHQMITTSEPGMQRELEIFRQIQRMRHMRPPLPSADEEDEDEKVRALTDLLRHMRAFRDQAQNNLSNARAGRAFSGRQGGSSVADISSSSQPQEDRTIQVPQHVTSLPAPVADTGGRGVSSQQPVTTVWATVTTFRTRDTDDRPTAEDEQ